MLEMRLIVGCTIPLGRNRAYISLTEYSVRT